MAALTQKQLRLASPVDELPYEIVRRYGEPKLVRTWTDVQKVLLADLQEIKDLWSKHVHDPQNDLTVESLRARLSVATPDDLPLQVDQVVDHWTGVKYQVTVRDRRRS